jgi:hypothetical protein
MKRSHRAALPSVLRQHVLLHAAGCNNASSRFATLQAQWMCRGWALAWRLCRVWHEQSQLLPILQAAACSQPVSGSLSCLIPH